ncbi:MAG: 6,7-dimethyl-8-ribityllumazine synthase [Acidobacteria bacterium]|nr:MAG: 6,7-dimethyl-8-ribityllumazine synthase [Acidobacteriota bacterium]REK01122.1 MAG: 6,7-dimethyl-8-ribityllumazine synthase [Acidobacteriota bacterium]
MHDIATIRGSWDGVGKRIGLVASRFNDRIVQELIRGAVEELDRIGVERQQLTLVRVPGAHEIPLALEEMAATGEFDALVALGVVIRGETAHFDYVCSTCMSGCEAVVRTYRIPVGLGVLTCETSEQAVERAGGKVGNKGAEAAQAAIEMSSVVQQLRAASTAPKASN